MPRRDRSPAARHFISRTARAARRNGADARTAIGHAVKEARRRGYRA